MALHHPRQGNAANAPSPPAVGDGSVGGADAGGADGGSGVLAVAGSSGASWDATSRPVRQGSSLTAGARNGSQVDGKVQETDAAWWDPPG